jgi:hypothetical protein
MTLEWEGEREDAVSAARAAGQLADHEAHAVGETLRIANEFSEIRVSRVETRNGARLLIEAPRSGQWVTLCPLELEALTWQSTATFSAMVGHPFGSLIADDREAFT